MASIQNLLAQTALPRGLWAEGAVLLMMFHACYKESA